MRDAQVYELSQLATSTEISLEQTYIEYLDVPSINVLEKSNKSLMNQVGWIH